MRFRRHELLNFLLQAVEGAKAFIEKSFFLIRQIVRRGGKKRVTISVTRRFEKKFAQISEKIRPIVNRLGKKFAQSK